MKKEFYSGYYYVYLSGYVLVVFLYYFISNVIIDKQVQNFIALAPFVLISIFFLLLSIYIRRKPILVITSNNYKIKKINCDHHIFNKKNTEITLSPKEIKFQEGGKVFLFLYRFSIGKKTWNQILLNFKEVNNE